MRCLRKRGLRLQKLLGVRLISIGRALRGREVIIVIEEAKNEKNGFINRFLFANSG